jgi:nucleotide-binding universal stress UspA family protein
MYRTVLVATDGSEASFGAVEHALGIAERNGATLHGLYVVDVGYPFSGVESGVDVVPVLEAMRSEGERSLATVEGRAEADGVSFVSAVRESDTVARTITDYAGEVGADLIVLGTHGRRGLNRWLLGSVAERVVRTASVPVLTVRAGGETGTGG